MKKSIFLIFMLLNINLVSAQTINILGKELSLLAVLPGVLTAVLVLFFIILFIKDSIGSYLKRKAEVKEIEIKEVKKEEVKEKSKFSKEEKMHSILARLKHLNLSMHTTDPKKSLSGLDLLAKDFFKEKYSIQQEYSLSELESLAGISKEEAEISKEISVLKYSGQQVNSSDLSAVNKNLYKIIKKSCQKDRQEKNYFQKLRMPKLGVNKEKIIKILKSVNLPKFSLPNLSWAKISFPRFSLSSILKRNVIIKEIEKGIRLSRADMHEAKKIYGKALIGYYHLPAEEAKLANKLAELHESIKEVPKDVEKKINRLIELKEKNKANDESKKLVSYLNFWINELETESRKKEIKERLEKSEHPVHVEIKTKPKSIEYHIKEITAYTPPAIPKKIAEPEKVKKFLEKEVINIEELRSRYKTLANEEYITKEATAYTPVAIPKKVDESKEVKKFLEEKKKIEKEMHIPKRKEVVDIEELRSRYRTLAEKESRYKPLSREVERKIDVMTSRYSSKSQI